MFASVTGITAPPRRSQLPCKSTELPSPQPSGPGHRAALSGRRTTTDQTPPHSATHSSAASVLPMMSLASSNFIAPFVAFALVLGANRGTAAWLAVFTSGSVQDARRLISTKGGAAQHRTLPPPNGIGAPLHQVTGDFRDQLTAP